MAKEVDKMAEKGLKELGEGAVKILSGAVYLTAANAIDSLVEDELRSLGARVLEILGKLQEEEEKTEETPPVEETKAEGEE